MNQINPRPRAIPSHANVIALMAGLSLLIHIDDALPAEACASMATVNTGTNQVGLSGWEWSTTGHFYLSQSSNGGLTGRMAGYVSSSCSGTDEYYNMNGAFNSSNGNFSLTATYTGSNSGCAPIINMSGTVTGPGCTAASGSWSNDRGLSGPLAMTQACQVPMGETVPAFQSWSTAPPDTFPVAIFYQQLSPATTYNWGGRTITETFPTNGVDSCWYPGSLIGKGGINHPPLLQTFSSNQEGYNDKLGLGTSNASYYRQHGRAPCGTTLYQTMVMDCPNPPGNQSFATGTLFLGVGQTTVTDIRNNVPATEVWGTPAPALTMIDIIFNLLF
jgi:hypothetical protein